jgi:hypothetical protein
MDLIDQILPELQDKARDHGYDALSHAERVVLDVTAVEAQVSNGGFDQFFLNQSGDRAKEGIAALREIGAAATAAIVEEACALFPKGGPSRKWATRQKQLLARFTPASFQELERRFFAYPDDTAKLLIAYWRAHGGKPGR